MRWLWLVIALVARLACAAPAFVNQMDYGATSGASPLVSSSAGGPAQSLSLTSGNTAIAYVAGAVATGFSDNLGNTYTLIQSCTATTSGAILTQFYSLISTGGTATFTATNSGGSMYAIYVKQVSGLASPIGHACLDTDNPAVGANTISSGSFTPSSSPSWLDGFGFNTQGSGGSGAPSAGTSPNSFTARTAVWGSSAYSSGPAVSLPEDFILSSAASTSATEGHSGSLAFLDILMMAAAFAQAGSSCTHPGWQTTSGGNWATPNGSTGSYYLQSGAIGTPNCSSISYWQQSGVFGNN